MAEQPPQDHWSTVAEQIRNRQDGNVLAGDDAPYYHYKGRLVGSRFLPRIPTKGKTILDVGCGAGGSLGNLRNRGASKLAGCDRSPGMAKLAQENVPEAEISLIDGEHLPYPDSAFDVVKTMTVLQHNPDSVATSLIGEICRVASEYVILFEDTERTWKPREEGTGAYQNFFGRGVDWYKAECDKHGWRLEFSDSLRTYVSLRTYNLLCRAFDRRRKEGQPFSRAHHTIGRLAMPVTSQLDKLIPPKDWELTMMQFRPK